LSGANDGVGECGVHRGGQTDGHGRSCLGT